MPQKTISNSQKSSKCQKKLKFRVFAIHTLDCPGYWKAESDYHSIIASGKNDLKFKKIQMANKSRARSLFR